MSPARTIGIGAALLALTTVGCTCAKKSTCTQPEIRVHVPYPGASAEEVEQAVALPIESVLLDVTAIHEVRTNAREGEAVLLVRPPQPSEIDAVRAEVVERLQKITSLPEDAERPIVSTMIPTGRRTLFALTGDVDRATLAAVAEKIRDDLERKPGVRSVVLHGFARRQITVEADDQRLAALGTDVEGVANALRLARLQGGRLDSPDQVVVKTAPDGTSIRLTDVATIRDGFDDEPPAFFRGQRAIVFDVSSADPIRGIDTASLPPELKVSTPRSFSENGCGVTGAVRISVAGPAEAIAKTMSGVDCDIFWNVGRPDTGYTFCPNEAVEKWRGRVQQTPGLSVTTIDGAGFRAKTLEVHHRSLNESRNAAAHLEKALREAGVLVHREPAKHELDIRISNHGRAAGIAPGLLARSVRTALHGQTIRGDPPIVVKLANPPKDVKDLVIASPRGQRLPLQQVAEISQVRTAETFRLNGRRYVPIDVSAKATDTDAIEAAIASMRQAVPDAGVVQR